MSKNKHRRIIRLNNGSIAAKKAKKNLIRVSPEVLRALTNTKRSQPQLSGLQIAEARITASHSTFSSAKRYRTWARKQAKPTHIGAKQLAKIQAKLDARIAA